MRLFFSIAAFLALILSSCARREAKDVAQQSEPTGYSAIPRVGKQKTEPKAASGGENTRDRPYEPSYRTGSLAKDEPQAIYSSDANDAWNRLFYLLFTRRVKVRVSEDFPDAGPFQSIYQLSSTNFSISERRLERIESGDRAIEPFYPLDGPGVRWQGVINAVTEPRFALLERSLRDALDETEQRPPLQRALLQSDIWAAYDILHKLYVSARASEDKARCAKIMVLSAKLVKKLALKPTEVDALPENLAAAARVRQLPNLFAPDSPWLEVKWNPQRTHDFFTDFRRATRVFLKPATPPADKGDFVNRLRPGSIRENWNKKSKLDAVALVTQLLVIDTNGAIVPTRLTYEIQLRTFVEGKEIQLEVGELSRKLLLSDPQSAGLTMFHNKDAAYLPFGGNDYSFASRVPLWRQLGYSRGRRLPEETVLVSLERRCAACHGNNSLHVRTFGTQEENPPVKILKPAEHEHALYVIDRKKAREDFAALQRDWRK